MKRLVLVLAVLALGVSATNAGAGTSSRQSSQSAQFAALQRQVNDLGAQVKALQKQVKTLQSHEKALNSEIAVNFISDACLAALTADALQASWGIVDQIVVSAGKPAIFGPQVQTSDKGACGKLIPPIAHSITVPPTAASLSALIAWLAG
jgi:hypothetical protein